MTKPTSLPHSPNRRLQPDSLGVSLLGIRIGPNYHLERQLTLDALPNYVGYASAEQGNVFFFLSLLRSAYC